MACEKRSFRITKLEEQPANTRWNAAFLYMHRLFVCGWCSFYMISHPAREAYVRICNGTHAVEHSGHINGTHAVQLMHRMKPQWIVCSVCAFVERM